MYIFQYCRNDIFCNFDRITFFDFKIPLEQTRIVCRVTEMQRPCSFTDLGQRFVPFWGTEKYVGVNCGPFSLLAEILFQTYFCSFWNILKRTKDLFDSGLVRNYWSSLEHRRISSRFWQIRAVWKNLSIYKRRFP